MNVPFGVGDNLYTGISENIHFLKRCHSTLDKVYIIDKYKRIEEALEWYRDNCIASYTSLKESFDELTELLNEGDHIKCKKKC